MPVASKSNELKFIRIYEAPLEAVWEAWTDLEQLAQWWGPRGFSITTHSKDLRDGGMWKYTMHGPGGVEYINTAKYLEVVPFAKLVYDQGAAEGTPPLFRATVLFSRSGEKTKMDMTVTFPSPEVKTQQCQIIKRANGYSTWDRLGEFVAKKITGKEQFIINRSFDASIEKMFEMWTSPEHIGKWMGPAGSTMEFIKADIRDGGSSFYCMSMDGGMKMFGRIDYLEIRKPDLIVYRQQFCDENEKVTRHPMSAMWPETMLTTVQFTAEGPDCTLVSLKWECHGDVTPEELATFVNARAGMNQGWTAAFDKLEDCVETMPT